LEFIYKISELYCGKEDTGENAFIFFDLKKNLKMNILIIIHL